MKELKNIFLIFAIALICNLNFSFAQISNLDAQISRIEKSIWGFSYTKEDVQKRLSRIEKNVFGVENLKLTQEQRLKKINESLGFENYEDSLKQAYEIEQAQESGDISYPQIDSLEYQMFKETYDKENIYKRIARLEKKIFGSEQDGNLSSRTERLKAYLREDVVAQDPNYYYEKPYETTQDIESYMGSQNKFDDSDVFIQLSGLEMALFSKTYSQDPVGLRLNRLERKIFQRDFSSDDENLRIQRLQAAANASKTAKLYEANKVQKFTSTGMQIGSIILMILALIL